MNKSFQILRFLSQSLFAAMCVWIGVEFAIWLKAMELGLNPTVNRPSGVEAFLPISSLMNTWHWITRGEIQMHHPAGVFIFLGIVAASFVLGKFFCSWMCPIGFFSEWLWKIRSRAIESKPVPIPRILDFILRSFKYIFLAFFMYAIFILLDPQSLHEFLESPYNLAADAKMFDFFANITPLAASVIAALCIVSIFVRNAWCRFFCPYGALLGIVGSLSPAKIRRSQHACIECEKCTRVCPAGISVHTSAVIRSDECSSCLECVSICPKQDALNVHVIARKKPVPWKWLPILALATYLFFVAWAMVTQRWNNVVDANFYKAVIQNRANFGHPGKSEKFTR